jgi:hypothetical protein
MMALSIPDFPVLATSSAGCEAGNKHQPNKQAAKDAKSEQQTQSFRVGGYDGTRQQRHGQSGCS